MQPPAFPDHILATLAAALLGAAIGAEREWRRHLGGLRSCALVAAAACVFNGKNRWLTRGIAALLEGPPALRSWLIDRYVVEGFTFRQVMEDDEALEAFIRKAAIGVWHASCSCRMEREDDPMAVVDTEGRVRGVGGLRVVDASIFPVVPCANTNFPVLMAAEKIADAMLADAGSAITVGGRAMAG